jgi:hypothetical protein
MNSRSDQLRKHYGFDFPEDLFRFWEFAKRLQPLDPLHSLHETLGVTLVGPFEMLAGRFDRRKPRYSLLLHWRYYLDPPEFFTVLSGNTDGLHWGYYLDDPPRGEGCIASYFARDAFEFSADGDTLFEAVRLHLEQNYRDCEDYAEDEPEYADDYAATMEQLHTIRGVLKEYGTGDRPETASAYEEAHAGAAARNERVVADTVEGMGIVVPPETYRPLSLSDRKLWAYLRRTKDPAKIVEEARQALRDGFPGTALKLGKDLWALGGERRTEYCYELLDAAYQALGREELQHVLEVHRANRDLPSVDILENEEGNGRKN